jgi:hypothetical protein
MITISRTTNGIRIERDGESYTATGPASVAMLITRLTTRPDRPLASTPARLGQRLAQMRQRYVVEV